MTVSSAFAPTLVALALTFAPAMALGQHVTSEVELRAAIARAAPGATITLADGTYLLTDRLVTPFGGTEAQPITVRAEHPRAAIVVTNGAEEAFRVTAPYWTFDGLHVRVSAGGVHAYKLESNGHHAVVRNGVMELEPGAESGIKAAGGARTPWPDAALIEHNEIYFTAPTTYFLAEGIDAVAVHDWVIRGNVIHGIRTSEHGVAFGAFTKGNSQGTIIEGNLVYDCFIGLSLGGGGTDSRYMRDGDTDLEDRDAIVRNNVVIGSDDVALYVYKASNTRVYNNTFFRSFTTCGGRCSSIDVRMEGATADVRNNLLDKPVLDREGGVHTEASNLMIPVEDDGAWFVNATARDLHLRRGTPPVDRGEALPLVPDDLDRLLRPGGSAWDLGAFELDGRPPPDSGVAPDAAALRPDASVAPDADAGTSTTTPPLLGTHGGCTAAGPARVGASWPWMAEILLALCVIRLRGLGKASCASQIAHLDADPAQPRAGKDR